MSDYTGIKITRPAHSIPVRPSGDPVRRTVVFTPSHRYFLAFCRASMINPRSRRITWGGTGYHFLSFGFDYTDVVFYDWSRCELSHEQCAWFDTWAVISSRGMVYSRGEAAMLLPDVRS